MNNYRVSTNENNENMAIKAVSKNDAVRIFANEHGYKTVSEPDIYFNHDQWVDSDGTLYWVSDDENQNFEDKLAEDLA